jgi:hypothetical protein
MTDSEREVELPELESRRGRAPVKTARPLDEAGSQRRYVAKVADPAPTPQIPSIYLIERAAIRLRRLRWESRKALAAAATEREKEEIKSTFRALEEPLKMYVHAQTSAASSDTPARRVGMKVRAFFGLADEQKP